MESVSNIQIQAVAVNGHLAPMLLVKGMKASLIQLAVDEIVG